MYFFRNPFTKNAFKDTAKPPCNKFASISISLPVGMNSNIPPFSDAIES